MENCMITFRSVTPAQRAESAVRRGGILCNLQRTPGFMREQGCGYSLVIRYPDVSEAVAILRQGKIPFQKIYLRQAGGGFEEIRL